MSDPTDAVTLILLVATILVGCQIPAAIRHDRNQQ